MVLFVGLFTTASGNTPTLSFPDVFVVSWHTRRDRRQRLRQELGKLEWPESRINYVYGTPESDEQRASQLGLSWARLNQTVSRYGDGRRYAGAALSHITALQGAHRLLSASSASGARDDLAIVLEDDFVWTPGPSTVRSILTKAFTAKAETFDVFLLACNPHHHSCDPHHHQHRDSRRATAHPASWGCALWKRRLCQTTSGYVVRRSYIPVLRSHWIRALQLAEARGNLTNRSSDDLVLDQSWKELQRIRR